MNMTTPISRFRKDNGGGEMTFPFRLDPRQEDTVVKGLKPKVYFYRQGEGSLDQILHHSQEQHTLRNQKLRWNLVHHSIRRKSKDSQSDPSGTK